jgi:uncharacterized membrane protein YbhN (UPF0104 family)
MSCVLDERERILLTKPSIWSWIRDHSKSISRIVWGGLLVIVIGIVAIQIKLSWNEIRTYPWHWNTTYIILGLGAYSVSLLTTASIWSQIIHRLSNSNNWLDNIGLYCLTNLAQRLPTPLPFLGARTEAYAARGIPRMTTLTAMSLEIAVTIVGALVAALITLPFGFPDALNQFNFLIWILIVPLMVFVIRPNWLIQAINLALQRLNKPKITIIVQTKDVILWVGLFVLVWMNGGLIYYLLANSIYPVGPDDLLAMINVFAISGVVGWLGQLLFFLPSVTLRQVAVAYLLSFFVPLSVAVAVALLTRLCVMIFELLWAMVFSIYFSYQQRKNKLDLL